MHLEAIISRAFLSFLAKFAIHATSKRICYTVTSRMEDIRWESLDLKKPNSQGACFSCVWCGQFLSKGDC